MAGSTVRIGDVAFGMGRLSFVAGPCQIESLQHALECALALKEASEALGVGLVYKSSFDKANRTSGDTPRGVGMMAGLDILAAVRDQTGLPVITDVHETWQCEIAAGRVDALQIPAFLSRQTDLLVAAGKTGLPVNLKKGQFTEETMALDAASPKRRAT
jgi:2-dehydro-3-deoxyphosphooctonate aldolase (KDO 8-P synthase)